MRNEDLPSVDSVALTESADAWLSIAYTPGKLSGSSRASACERLESVAAADLPGRAADPQPLELGNVAGVEFGDVGDAEQSYRAFDLRGEDCDDAVLSPARPPAIRP